MTRKQSAACTFLGHAILLLPAAAFFFGGDAGAQSPLQSGRPTIGTFAYSAGCVITDSYEDGSAIAYCTSDNKTWHFDPDGQFVPGIADNPVRGIGWFVQE